MLRRLAGEVVEAPQTQQITKPPKRVVLAAALQGIRVLLQMRGPQELQDKARLAVVVFTTAAFTFQVAVVVAQVLLAATPLKQPPVKVALAAREPTGSRLELSMLVVVVVGCTQLATQVVLAELVVAVKAERLVLTMQQQEPLTLVAAVVVLVIVDQLPQKQAAPAS